MKTLSINDFKPEWLKRRVRICALPTEFVYPCKYTHGTFDLVPDFAYGYRLTDEEMAPVLEKGKNWESWTRWVAVELHEDYGDDGHVNYIFRDLFFLIREDQLPKNTKEYAELIQKYYEQKRLAKENNPS
jgi:hypothetical protein